MKFDLTYKGCDVVTALKRILGRDSGKLPAMILWNDEPRSEVKLQRYLSSINHCYFLRFGVACSGAFILDEVYHQLTSRPCNYRIPDLKARAISKLVRNTKRLHIFVVSNCHLIATDQISWLTGLMFEFDFRAKFIFLFHRDHLHKSIHSKGDKDARFQYFLKQIKRKYAIAG